MTERKLIVRSRNFPPGPKPAMMRLKQPCMGKIEGWKKGVSKLKEKVFAMKKVVAKHSLDQSIIASSVAVMKNLETEMQIVVKTIEAEDENR